LLAQKCGLQYQMILSLEPRLPSNENWRKTSYMIKTHNCELLQRFTYPEPNSVNSVFCNSVYFVCIFAFRSFFPCTHPVLFSMKAHSIVFSFVFVFCASLICFCSIFCILFKHTINHTTFFHLNLIHSSVYIGMPFHLYMFFTIFCVCLFSQLGLFHSNVVLQNFSITEKQGWLTRWPPWSLTNPIHCVTAFSFALMFTIMVGLLSAMASCSTPVFWLSHMKQ